MLALCIHSRYNTSMTTDSPNSFTLHGVFLDVLDMGVMLMGESGIGKSEVALTLIHRGHRLIADDAPCFTPCTTSQLIGSCPPVLQDFLEVRGLGVINIRAMFGEVALKQKKPLQLIIQLKSFSAEALQQVDRLKGINSTYTVASQSIPVVTLPVAPGRNMGALVEAAVRNEKLKLSGYNASDDFCERQARQLQEKQLT